MTNPGPRQRAEGLANGTDTSIAVLLTRVRVLVLVVLAVCLLFPSIALKSDPRVSTFTLDNGMQVVVIPDHRVPVVTHMVIYRVGAADDPWGASGIAHFLEHLMFKSTDRTKSGDFARIITGLGGRDNALTAHDTTAYFQRVAKEHLRTVMALEAERMVNLRLVEQEIQTERAVVQEERRSNIDANPVSILSEQMLAQLYLNHPYGRPVLGWPDEIAKMSLDDAARTYKRYYAPNNAVLVVAGDATVDEVRALAEATYGRNAPNFAISPRQRPQEPEPVGPRWVRVIDERAGTPIILRYYHVPSFLSARPGEAEALTLLSKILGGYDASLLHQELVLADPLASTVGSEYMGDTLDSGRIAVLVVVNAGVPLEKIERALDLVVAKLHQEGVSQDDLDRARGALDAERIFQSDSQMALARHYGEAIALGRTIDDMDALPRRLGAISPGDIRRVAGLLLVPERSVTGVLNPSAIAATSPELSAPLTSHKY